MLSSANKKQLSEIAEYIGADFGIVDELGHVLFYSGKQSESDISKELLVIFLELQNDDAYNLYETSKFSRGKFLFENVTVDNDELIFMFINLNTYANDDVENNIGTYKNILALAAHGFKYRESQSSF